MQKFNKLLLTSCAAMAMFGGAYAQQESGDEGTPTASERRLGPVTITAQKRAEDIQDVPISVTAFQAQDLQNLSITDVSGIGAATPNLDLSFTVGGSGGGNAQATVRGIGQTDFLITSDPGVGIYLDGVYLGRTTGSVLDLLDVGSIEVLRGPQGTLFGKNTIGGAINVTTKPASETFEGYIRATTGEFNRADIELGVSGPVVKDQLLGAISVASNNRDGYAVRMSDGLDLGDIDAIVARGKLQYVGGENFEATLAVDFAQKRENGSAIDMVAFNDNGSLVGLWNGFVGAGLARTISSADANPDNDIFTTAGTGPAVNNLDQIGVGLTLEWDLGWAELKSITAYRDMEAMFGRDMDSTDLQYVHTLNTVNQDQFSQEVLLSGNNDALTWIGGLYYFDENATDENDVRLASGLYDALEALPASLACLDPMTAPPPCMTDPLFGAPGGTGNPINIGLDLDFDVFNQISTQSYAAFGQLGYDISETLSLTGGLRYTNEDKEYTIEHLRVNAGVPIIPFQVVSDSWDAVSGKVGIDYKPNEDTLVYGSVSTGFKSGGFNGRPTAQGELQSFDPETVTNYEIGLKSTFLDGIVRTNIAAFFAQYDDIQLQILTLDETGNFIQLIENAAEAEISGFEFEGTLAPTDSLTLNAGIGYTNAEYIDPGLAAGSITTESEFPRTPEWNLNFGGEYTFDLGSAGDLAVRADYFYKDDYFQDVVNTAEIAQKGYGLVNLRTTYYLPGDEIQLSAFVTNLTDEAFFENGVAAFDSFGTTEIYPGRPQEWGLSLLYRF
ncbi:MAG: TonB-dependent receptor [Henriciella sp.]